MKNTKNKYAKMRSILATQIRRICAIAIVAAIGFSITACGDNEDNGGLTITGLDKKFNGKFAIASDTSFLDVEEDSDTSGLIAAASIDMNNMNVTGGKINGNSVTLKVWESEGDENNPEIIEYSGNDTVSFYVVILKEATLNAATFAGIEDNSDGSLMVVFEKIAGFGTVEVTFKNGVASGKFIEGSLFDLM